MRLGALEAGGTKMVMSVGLETGEILERAVIETRSPQETMPPMVSFFQKAGIEALGIGSFGPIDPDPASATYGFITTTPKQGWQHFPILRAFQRALPIPMGFDTDVNVAAWGEYELGAGRGFDPLVYFTVGTGVGGGIVAGGRLIHGLLHPEPGHMLLRPHPDDPMPRGVCPFHDACLEGLACGPSLLKRWGKPGRELPEDHAAWALEAEYLAQMCVNLVTILSPRRIILGGGVMQKPSLLPRVRARTRELLGDYVQHEMILSRMDEYIVSPGLGANSGVTGALLLARDALRRA